MKNLYQTKNKNWVCIKDLFIYNIVVFGSWTSLI